MSICAPGHSAPILGVQRTVVMATASAEALLAFTQPELALVLAPFIGAFTFDTTQICAVDPPSDPGLTPADVAALAQFSVPEVSLPAVAKLYQWFLSWYWFKICTCVGATTPAAPTPSNPGVTVSIAPGAPQTTIVQPCWTSTTTFRVPAGTPTLTIWADSVLPQANEHVFTFGANTVHSWSVPNGVPSVTVTCTSDPVASGGGLGVGTDWFYWDDTNASKGSGAGAFIIGVGATTATITHTPAVPAGATRWSLDVSNSDTVDHQLEVTVTFNCNSNTAPSINTPCCPPDPALDQKLQQIIGLLTGIWDALPANPTSYAESTIHSGLTLNGTVALGSSTIAIKVAITADSTGAVIKPGSPNYYFDRGYIVPITLEAPIRGPVRLVYNPQQYNLPPLTEQIGYTLPPGVTISITELVRGP